MVNALFHEQVILKLFFFWAFIVGEHLDPMLMSTFCGLHFFFFFEPVPFTLYMGHEQFIKANEQYFVTVNSNQKLFFYCFQFSAK